MIFIDELQTNNYNDFLVLEVDDFVVKFHTKQDNVFINVFDFEENELFSSIYDTIGHFNKEQWDEITLRNAMRNYIVNFQKTHLYDKVRISKDDLDKYITLFNIKGGETSLQNNFKKIPILQLCDFSFEIQTPSFRQAMNEGNPPYSEKYKFELQKNRDNSVSPRVVWHDTIYIWQEFDIKRFVNDLEKIIENERTVDEIYKITRGYEIDDKEISNAIYIGKNGFEKSVKILKNNPTIEGLKEFRTSLEEHRILMKKEWIKNPESFIVSPNGYEFKEDNIQNGISYEHIPGGAIVCIKQEDVYLKNGKYYTNKIYTKNDLEKMVLNLTKNYIEEGENDYDL